MYILCEYLNVICAMSDNHLVFKESKECLEMISTLNSDALLLSFYKTLNLVLYPPYFFP